MRPAVTPSLMSSMPTAMPTFPNPSFLREHRTPATVSFSTAFSLAPDVIAIVCMVADRGHIERFVVTPATSPASKRTPLETALAIRDAIAHSSGNPNSQAVHSIDVLLRSGSVPIRRSCSLAELTDVLRRVLETLSTPESRGRLLQI